VYLGPSGRMLTGSALLGQQAQERAQAVARGLERGSKKRELEHTRHAMEAKVAALRAEYEIEQMRALRMAGQDRERAAVLIDDRVRMARQRHADSGSGRKTSERKSGGPR
jgi:circadian clock protein KaiC